MNKNILLAIGGILVVVLIGGFLMFSSRQNGNEATNSDGNKQSATRSLRDFLGMTEAQKCAVNSSNDMSASAGTVYVAGGKMRGDFTSQAQGQTMMSHMITDGEISYVWSDGTAYGIKMSLNQAQPSQTEQPTSQNSVDMNQQVNYDCEAWTTDESQFVPPTNITFSDMTEMMKPQASSSASPGSNGNTGASSQCGYCNSIPDAASKAQCKAAFNCN